MANLKACDECGGTMIDVPVAGKDDRPALLKDNTGRYPSRDSLVFLERAHVCLECGFVRLYANPAEVRRRLLPAGSAPPG